MQRRCFIHAGVHKTGTTTFQQTLALNRAALADVHLHVPTAGWVDASPGHHNIAFAIRGDEWFQSATSAVDELRRELTGRDADIVVSSEVFSCLTCEQLRTLNRTFLELHLKVEFVVVLRHQSETIPALYWEAVKHGSEQTFDDFFERVLGEGKVRIRTLDIPLEYDHVAAAINSVGGQLHVCAYTHVAAGDTLIRSLFDMVQPGLGAKVTVAPSSNERAGPYTTEAYRLLNQIGRSGESSLRGDLLRHAAEKDRQLRLGLSDEQRAAVTKRFAASNRQLAKCWHVDLNPPAQAALVSNRRAVGLDAAIRDRVAEMSDRITAQSSSREEVAVCARNGRLHVSSAQPH